MRQDRAETCVELKKLGACRKAAFTGAPSACLLKPPFQGTATAPVSCVSLFWRKYKVKVEAWQLSFCQSLSLEPVQHKEGEKSRFGDFPRRGGDVV